MALGKTKIEQVLKDDLESFLHHEFEYKAPFLYKKEDHVLKRMNIQASNLDLINVGPAGIKFYEIEKIVEPIIKEYGYVHGKWSSTFIEIKREENLSHVKVESEEDVKRALLKIRKYITNIALPFWEEYVSLPNIMKLIESKTEEELNQMVFQGMVGIMHRFVIAKMMNEKYYREKKQLMLSMLNEYVEQNPEKYSNMLNAFNMLVTKLEQLE